MEIGDTGTPNYGILTQRFMSSGQWDRALATSMEWLGKEPENLRAHRIAAQSLINLRRAPEAQPHLERVLAGNPRDDFGHRLMCMIHVEQKRFKAADESIRQAIALNPYDAYHWHQSALLSYRLGDLATAKKCAEKARGLRPRDPNILNLVIMCEPKNQTGAQEKIRLYEEALALDPENSSIHNNIGTEYLALKDYKKAEEFFRRSLFFNPSSAVVRKNLFLTVRRHDQVYRALCAPKDFLFQVWNIFGRMRKNNILLYLLIIPVWIFAFRFVLFGLILWFVFVWPMTKVYEFLTIGDIRARAGEVGARRGGFLGYRKWSLHVRLSIFAVLLVLFWSAIAILCVGGNYFGDADTRHAILGLLLFLALLVWIGVLVRAKIRSGVRTSVARDRARHIDSILTPPKIPKRKWW